MAGFFLAERFDFVARDVRHERSALFLYIRYSLVLARFWDFFNFFMKKDVKIFAGSKNVVTFASAFEKTRFLQRLKVCNRGARNP